MPRLRRMVLTGLSLVSLLLCCVAVPRVALAAPLQKAEAIVLVNSASPSFSDFDRFIRPYLDTFGVPRTTLDIANAAVDGGIADYALIIVGHQHLDPSGTLLDAAEQAAIASAVREGTGLVNFDGDLWANGTPRYAFVQDVFNLTPAPPGTTTSVSVPPAAHGAGPHFITAAHQPGESLTTGPMQLPGFTLPASGQGVVLSGTRALVAVTAFGSGRGVQWGSYAWMSHAVFGPMHGLDDVVWRSLAWAARKPFVMQALPPIVTMRVDDVHGPLDWAHTANGFGLKPWIGIFLGEINERDAADLRSLVHQGNATASMHGFDANTFFYFNHHDHLRVRLGFDTLTSRLSLGGRVWSGVLAVTLVLAGGVFWRRSSVSGSLALAILAGVLFGLATLIKLKVAQGLLSLFVVAVAVAWRRASRRALIATTVAALVATAMFAVWSLGVRRALIGPGDWPDETVATYYAQANQWHAAHDIPVSRFVVPHFYEFGTNIFKGLADWGVEFVGTQVTPGVAYGGPWLRGGPYRTSENGNSEAAVPSYYADFLSVPGRPEYDGRFFNCVTEIRDDNGYEWLPTANVTETVGHGTRQLKRALDSRALATLFTHEYYIASIPAASWKSILQSVTANVASYRPRYMTMDDACRYVRALHTSSIASSVFEPETGVLRTTLTGASDMATAVSVFTADGESLVEQELAVPPFAGSTEVSSNVRQEISARLPAR